MNRRNAFLAVFAALLVTVFGASPAMAQCPSFICYLDLTTGPGPNGADICPNTSVYNVQQRGTIASVEADCPANVISALVEVTLPTGCTALEATVEFVGEPRGWSVDIGDSPTVNGFGGDAPGTVPGGQNAELEILDGTLVLYSAATAPPVAHLARQHLALEDGALKLRVEDQAIQWGQPFSRVESIDDRLFFLADPPLDNRTLHLGFNRVVANTGRTGCGVGHVLMFTK